MTRVTRWAALLFPLALGCSARTQLEDRTAGGGPGGEEPACLEEPEPRVEDCARASTDAVPIAELRGDGFHLAADEAYLYYASEQAIFRLAMSGGEPEPLTPPGAGGAQVKYAEGYVYWLDGDLVRRVRATGGEVEDLVKLPPQATWAVAEDAILSAGSYTAPSPVYRTSLGTGETSELLPEDPEQPIWDLGVAGDRVFVERSDSLISVPLDGGEAQLVYDGGTGGGQPPIAHDGQVYFTGSFTDGGAFGVGILRVDIDPPHAAEVFLRGYGVAFAADDRALYAHVIPTPGSSDEPTTGTLVRAPFAGGVPTELTRTSGKGHLGYEISSNGLAVSGCYVYFVDRCTELPGNEFRIVAVPKTPGE